MDSSGEFYRPDFVILGVPAEEGVYVYASKHLTMAELKMVVQHREFDPYRVLDRIEPERPTVVLTATMREFVLVNGATYAEAFRSLFDHWVPDEEGRKQIAPTRAGIGKVQP